MPDGLTPNPAFPEDMRETVEWWANQDYSGPGGIPAVIAHGVQALARWALERDAEAKRLAEGERAAVELYDYSKAGVHWDIRKMKARAEAAEAKLAEAHQFCKNAHANEADARREIHALQAKLAEAEAEIEAMLSAGGAFVNDHKLAEHFARVVTERNAARAKLAAGRAEADWWSKADDGGIGPLQVAGWRQAGQAIQRAME